MPREKWTLEVLQAEAKKYMRRTEFEKGSPNAYAAASRKKLLDKICLHMETKERDSRSRMKFNPDQEKAVAEEYESG